MSCGKHSSELLEHSNILKELFCVLIKFYFFHIFNQFALFLIFGRIMHLRKTIFFLIKDMEFLWCGSLNTTGQTWCLLFFWAAVLWNGKYCIYWGNLKNGLEWNRPFSFGLASGKWTFLGIVCDQNHNEMESLSWSCVSSAVLKFREQLPEKREGMPGWGVVHASVPIGFWLVVPVRQIGIWSQLNTSLKNAGNKH